MEVIRIIDRNNHLLSVRYGDAEETEFSKIFTFWNDTEALFSFFSDNAADLKTLTIQEAVLEVIDAAAYLEDRILDNAESGLVDFLQEFKPLHLNPDSSQKYILNKLYGPSKRIPLRLYGIRLRDDAKGDTIIVTGGAIKLTRAMQDRPHTKLELDKLDQVMRYLRHQNFSSDEIEFLELEL